MRAPFPFERRNTPVDMSANRADQITIATLGENRPPYLGEIETLFGSIRRLTGGLERARRIAYVVGDVSLDYQRRLASLQVELRVVEAIDPRCPHANKIAMLVAEPGISHLVLLDTDTVVLRDFSAFIHGTAIAAKPADDERLAPDQWQSLYDYFALPLPRSRFTTSSQHQSLQEIQTYFNSGVIVVPSPLISALREQWQTYVGRLLDFSDAITEIAPHRFFVDQFAFALAVAGAGIPYRPLPLAMNFPTHQPLHPAHDPDTIRPYIIHHHHRCASDGSILPCSHTAANVAIAEFNRFRQREGTSPVSARGLASSPGPGSAVALLRSILRRSRGGTT